MKTEKTYISKKRYFELVEEFVKTVSEFYKDSELNSLCIVAVARGGLVPGQLLSYYLSLRVPKVLVPVFVYQPYFGVPSLGEISEHMKKDHRSEVIIVDEICDTGKALLDLYNTFGGGVFVRTAALIRKVNPEQVYSPDIWIESVPNEWVEFFYDREEWR